MFFMKRINIDTGKEYQKGDSPTKEDLPARKGLVFLRFGKHKTYKTTDLKKGIRKDFWVERWVTPKQLEEHRKNVVSYSSALQTKHKQKEGKKELNPATGKFWQKGEQNEQGWYFISYKMYVRNNGYRALYWKKTFDEYHRKRIQFTQQNKPLYCKKHGLEFNLGGVEGLDYLVSIFPKDFRCPILDIKMEWSVSARRYISPSLDRLIPTKGYVKGNVAWISSKANLMKSNANLKEIESLYRWVKEGYEKAGIQT